MSNAPTPAPDVVVVCGCGDHMKPSNVRADGLTLWECPSLGCLNRVFIPTALSRTPPPETREGRCFDCGCPQHVGACPECGHQHSTLENPPAAPQGAAHAVAALEREIREELAKTGPDTEFAKGWDAALRRTLERLAALRRGA